MTRFAGTAPGRPSKPNGSRWSSSRTHRLTAATTDLFSAATNGRPTHFGDPRLAAHVGAAVVTEDARGPRLAKASRSRNARKIDLAACLVMAHSRATWRATRRTRKKARSFR
jgi:phage terminase large subunit-like protein